MLPEDGSGSESHLSNNTLDGKLSGLQQMLRSSRPRFRKPLGRTQSRLFAEPSAKGPCAHPRVPGDEGKRKSPCEIAFYPSRPPGGVCRVRAGLADGRNHTPSRIESPLMRTGQGMPFEYQAYCYRELIITLDDLA